MVPQAPKNNQQVWRELEEATRAMVTKQKQDVYVVTGPVYSAKKLENHRQGCDCCRPQLIRRSICLKKALPACTMQIIPLRDTAPTVKVMSICALEELTGINVFPELTEDQKRNTYRLPLKATQVKQNQEIAYLHWDAESPVCRMKSSPDKITAPCKKSLNRVVAAYRQRAMQDQAPIVQHKMQL